MRALIIAWLACWCASAWSDCRDDVAPARVIGQGEFCVLGFCLYDAQLLSERTPIAYDAPFALLITYKRHISRDRLADTGIDEIRRLADPPLAADTLTRWRGDMQRAFVDVSDGDSLCGVFLPGKGVRFYSNGMPTVEVDDPAFARAFFGIWLDPHTRAPTLRAQLLGATR